MTKINKDFVVGIVGAAAGLIGVGYAVGIRTKLGKSYERLDLAINNVADNIDVDISEAIVNEAVEKAVATEAKRAVEKATTEVLTELKKDIHTKAAAAVESEYETVREKVLAGVTDSAAKIDVVRVRRDVEKAAEKAVMDKLDVNMEDILKRFNDELHNTGRIYQSIANALSTNITRPSNNNNGEFVFRLN